MSSTINLQELIQKLINSCSLSFKRHTISEKESSIELIFEEITIKFKIEHNSFTILNINSHYPYRFNPKEDIESVAQKVITALKNYLKKFNFENITAYNITKGAGKFWERVDFTILFEKNSSGDSIKNGYFSL